MVTLPPLKLQLSQLHPLADAPSLYVSPLRNTPYMPVTPPDVDYHRPTYRSIQTMSPQISPQEMHYSRSDSPSYFEPRLSSAEYLPVTYGGGVSSSPGSVSPNLPPNQSTSVHYPSQNQYYTQPSEYLPSAQVHNAPHQYFQHPPAINQMLSVPPSTYGAPTQVAQWYPQESTRKLYVCDHPSCSKSYTRKYNLLTHQISVHSDSRPYCCKICNTSFSRPHDLRRHNRSLHSDYRPYKCSHCEMTFARSDALKRHMDRDENRVRKGGHSCDKMRAFRRAVEKTEWKNNTNQTIMFDVQFRQQSPQSISNGEPATSGKAMRISDMLN